MNRDHPNRRPPKSGGNTIAIVGVTLVAGAAIAGMGIIYIARGREPSPTLGAETVTLHDNAIPPAASELVMRAPPAVPSDFMSMPEYAFDKTNTESFCREEWTKRGSLDTGMFNYCVGEERDGYREIPSVMKKFGTYTWMRTLFPAIWSKWTKRGVTQYSMVAFELKQETDKFLDYQYEQKQPDYDASKMAACLSQWGASENVWSMTMFCYKQD